VLLAVDLDPLNHLGLVIALMLPCHMPVTLVDKIGGLAVFGEFTYDLGEVTRLTVGARYTDEEKTFSGRTEIVDPTVDMFFPGFPGLISPGLNGGLIDEIYDIAHSTSWDDVTFKLSLQHDFSADVMTYFLFSQGFKSGGYQGTSATRTEAMTPFDPENVDNYEVGLSFGYIDSEYTSFEGDPRREGELVVWVRNALDEEYWLGNSLTVATSAPEAAPRMIAPPQTIGATVNYRFGGRL
jgi:outer membrane receptor protein involved in Fe transport